MAKVYQPQIKVTLIKAAPLNPPNNEIAPGKPVNADRYGGVTEIDLTPWLGDNSSVETTKSVRQPAGTFALTFPDKPYKGESLYAFIKPMDFIEIRMAHDSQNTNDGVLPLIMRGFVSSVNRPESISGGKPVRMIKITGHDYGKLLQIIQIIYLPGSITGNYYLEMFRWFQQYANASQVKTKSATEFINEALDQVVNRFIGNLIVLTKPRKKAQIIDKITSKVSVNGNVSAYTPNSFSEVSLYQMLKTIMDAPVFNEFYVEDSESGVSLVVRPVPFKEVTTRQFIQGSADSLDIDDVDIISPDFDRSDNSVANYFWVTGSRYSFETNQLLKLVAAAGDLDSFVLFDYPNCALKTYGIRKMEAETTLMPTDYSQSNSPKADQIPHLKATIEDWITYRRKLLAAMNKDNVILETGSLQLRGNEAIKAGTYLTIYRGGVRMGEVYAHTVSHQFRPFQGFFTTVQFDRGTCFYERSQANNSFYYREADNGGVLGAH